MKLNIEADSVTSVVAGTVAGKGAGTTGTFGLSALPGDKRLASGGRPEGPAVACGPI